MAAGIDPVLVGMVVMAVFRKPYLEVIRGTPPFIAILLLVSVLLVTFPSLALSVRDLAF